MFEFQASIVIGNDVQNVQRFALCVQSIWVLYLHGRLWYALDRCKVNQKDWNTDVDYHLPRSVNDGMEGLLQRNVSMGEDVRELSGTAYPISSAEF